ncbi:type II toxin-antitoxin system YafQ family toxin [Levilactobacillus fujinensis]|uniref:Type II toxin-antitoxin system YafQ family toxin n=1 Tax=Levilactobacillus fujinensis TaxID=2486024 RepID=A0ABW1THV9_9LACO|nr:type II toxin-antitoxin system YafQ family toxin [Levilactobacillus fujinensis]
MTKIPVYKVAFERKFKKHYQHIIRGNRYEASDFKTIYHKLINDELLEAHNNDHPLVNRKPERELHIKPDWLLIYKYDGDFIRFLDTDSHSDLFK